MIVLSAIWIPDALWSGLAALVGGGVVAYLTQRLTRDRELRKRLHELRVDLYLEVIDLVLDNQIAIAQSGRDGAIAPMDLQLRRLRTSHRLKLLGPSRVNEAYRKYHSLVFQETAHPVEDRPLDPAEVDGARDRLIEEMVLDVQRV
jgi:hypothetical protein